MSKIAEKRKGGSILKRYFIITIDTEGDNLWERATTKNGIREITTKNADYVERFQELCERYHFLPTYLVDYEMAMSEKFVGLTKAWLREGKCEIGMHMHAWNTPPLYKLPFFYKGHNPYAGEYPHNVMRKKLEYMTGLIEDRFGIRPTSHRGGRWYIDAWYVSQLIKLGYKVDCSITPGISWQKARGNTEFGPDYSRFLSRVFYMDENRTFLQVTPSIIRPPILHTFTELRKYPYDYKNIFKKRIWLRPNGKNRQDMLYIVKKQLYSPCNYIEFMLHSSELMPGGSPTFKNETDIEQLYADLEKLFFEISKNYVGVTLSEYYRITKDKNDFYNQS